MGYNRKQILAFIEYKDTNWFPVLGQFGSPKLFILSKCQNNEERQIFWRMFYSCTFLQDFVALTLNCMTSVKRFCFPSTSFSQ